jgi:hypothetical protein
MAERRMLHRLIAKSRRVNLLSDGAALLWTWAIPFLDDFGRLEVAPDMLKSTLAPRRREWTAERIAHFLIDMHNEKAICLYVGEDREPDDLYAVWYKFEKFQTFKSDRAKQAYYPQPFSDGAFYAYLPRPLDYDVWDEGREGWNPQKYRIPLDSIGFRLEKKEGMKEGSNRAGRRRPLAARRRPSLSS